MSKVDPNSVWPKRMSVSEYRDIGFAGDKKPCVNWIKKQIQEGIYYGEQVGTKWFVFVDQNYQAIRLKKPTPSPGKLVSTGDAVADKLLQDYVEEHAA